MNALNTCGSCRFFGSSAPLDWYDADDEEHASEHHYCARVQHGNGGSAYQREALAKDAAVVTDGSGYAARLRVLPSFGCTLHEPRTP